MSKTTKIFKVLTSNGGITAFYWYDVALMRYQEKKLSVVLKNHTVIEITDCGKEDAEKVIDAWMNQK